MSQTATTTANAQKFIVPSFVDANFIAGRLSVGVYHMAERTTTESFNFSNAANALNYAFLLKKRHGITIARRAFDLILWEIKRTGAISSRAQARAEVMQKTEAESTQFHKVSKVQSIARTPLMKQYEEMKKKHPDAILLFRCGDFYECFAEDAQTASDVLGITLTTRVNGKADKIYLAGFPHHALDTYLPKLVRAGHRVAICEQLEEPKKTRVKRVKKV